MSLLTVDSLSVRYGTHEALADIALTVAPGEIRGIVGESGSGKSTLGLAVLGLLPPGTACTGTIARPAARIAYVPQEPMTALNPTLRVGRQVDLVLARQWREPFRARRARAETALAAMGVADPPRVLASFPFQLSGGLLQRVLLTQAFALEPQLLIADEPTTALDVTVQAEVLALLEQAARARGAGVLFVSHNIAVVWNLCDSVTVMRRGRIVEQGDCRRLLAAPAEEYTRALLAAHPSRTPPRTLLPVGNAA